jgi:hypothetical protein
VLRRSALCGVPLALALAATAQAAAPARLKVVTRGGKNESLSYVSYTFGVSTPPLGKSGKITVDAKTPNEAAVKRALKAGTKPRSAGLTLDAELPTPQHFTYHFAGAKITSISFVTGNLGPVAAITLSFTKLTK